MAAHRKVRLRIMSIAAVVLAVFAVVVNYRYQQWLATQPPAGTSPTSAPAERLNALPSGGLPSTLQFPAAGGVLPTGALLSQTGRVSPAAGGASAAGAPLPLLERLRHNPQDRAARFSLAHYYFQVYNYTGAMRELDILEKDNPRDPEVHIRKAVVRKYQGKPTEAESEARRALALDPGYGLAEQFLGEVYLDTGRYRDALDVFEHLLKRTPDAALALLAKGRTLEKLYLAQSPVKVRDMLAPVEKAAALAPNNPQVLAALARMKFAYLDHAEALAEAEQLARRAISLEPRDPQPYITVAQIYLARPPTPDNLQMIEEFAGNASMLDTRDPRPPFLIGRVALLRNDVKRAANALERSIALHPMPEAVSQLSMAYRRAGNTARADRYASIYRRYSEMLTRRDALLSARERQPRNVRRYYDLVALYLEAKQPATATAWLERARSLRPRDSEAARLASLARRLEKTNGGDELSLALP